MPMVISVTGLGRSTIFRLIAKKQFPGPVCVGQRAVAWRQADLDDCSDARLPPKDQADLVHG
jgi:prophage regulatory protein